MDCQTDVGLKKRLTMMAQCVCVCVYTQYIYLSIHIHAYTYTGIGASSRTTLVRIKCTEIGWVSQLQTKW